MSIVVEGMMMPECCMKCPMAVGYGCGYMRVAMTTKDMKLGRHPDCPLGEISKPKTDRDMISRQAAIDEILGQPPEPHYPSWYAEQIKDLPSVQPESYKGKLKEIADALSERFAYLNTCLNERDIILSYLGVKRPSKIHCNTDCTNVKCKSYRYNKKLPSAQHCGADMRGKQDGNKEEGSQIHTHQKPRS